MSYELSVPADLSAVRAALGVKPKLQLVATRCQLPTDPATDSGGTSINHDTRTVHRIGPSDVTGLRLLLANMYTSAVDEVDGPNTIAYRAALEIWLTDQGNGQTRPFTFGGNPLATIDGKTSFFQSDPIETPLLANTSFNLRQNIAITSGQTVPVGLLPIQTGMTFPTSNIELAGPERTTRAAGATAVYSTGAFTGAGTACFSPVGIIGYPTKPIPAVVIDGHSIAYGQADTGTSLTAGQSIGYCARGMMLPNGTMLPFTVVAKPGAAVYPFNVQSGRYANNVMRRRLGPLEYATDVINDDLTNDIQSGSFSLAAIQAACLKKWAYQKAFGVRITQVKVLPRTDASNNPITNFTTGSLRDQINSWIDTQVGGGLLDDVIDLNAYLEDPANHSKWLPAYLPTDGVHPLTAANIAAAAGVQAWAVRLAQSYGLPTS